MGSYTKEDNDAFRSITEPVVKWLCENGHPHMHITITPTSAELSEGCMAYYTESHIKD